MDVGNSYRNDKQAQKFTYHSAEIERENIRKRIEEAKFLTLIVDGTTDSGTVEAEMVYARYCARGQICVNFVSYVNVERANAPGIIDGMKTAMHRLGIPEESWVKKLVGLGSDGASVMMGKKRGVIALLKELQPACQGIHCAAHRLELAYKDALRKVPIHLKVEGLMLNLYLFYKKSALNRSMLKRTYEVLQIKSSIPTRVGGTRWIPHTVTAIQNLLKGYSGITTHLSQIVDNNESTADARGKAKNYVNCLLNRQTVMYLHLLLDVTEALKALSLTLQKKDATVADIHDTLNITVKTLSKYKAK